MASNNDSAPKQALMYLDDRLAQGFVVVCAGYGAEHSFVLRGLGLSIECPRCGRTELSSRLLDVYYERLSRFAASGAAIAPYSKMRRMAFATE